MFSHSLKKCLSCFLFLLLLLSIMHYSPKPAEAASYTVTKLADTNDGTCDADCSLREAIGLAVSGETVNFANGLTGTIILSTQLSITQAITINGPGMGVITVSGNDLIRVFETTAGSGNTININNLTIANGKVNGNGGGIYNHNGNLTLNLVFMQNHVLDTSLSYYGGALANTQGTLTITNSVLSDNTARVGGAIFNDAGGILTISNTAITDNSALAGGGIYALNSNTVTMNTVTFAGNVALFTGGGGGAAITAIQSNALNIQNSSFVNNQGNNQNGGALLVYLMTATVTNTTFDGNTGVDGGGIFIGSGSNITLDNVDLLNNTASNSGGGIYNEGIVTIQNNSVLNGNSAVIGGGIINHVGGALNVSGSVLQGNSASTNGGAVYNNHNTPNVISVTGSCIVENSATAFFNNTTSSQIATNNWWGSSDGPSGVGPGSGDSVSADVNYTPFLTAAILGCPDFTPTPTPTNTPVTPTNTPVTPTDTPITPTLTPTCAIVVVPPTLQSPVHRTHTTDTTPTFTWSQVSGAQSYRLMVYTEDRSFEFKKRRVGQTSTNYTLTNAEALVPAKYLWRVRTQDLGCGTWTSWSTRNTLFID